MAMRIEPSKPSVRVAVNVSSRPLPGLTFDAANNAGLSLLANNKSF
jgi:hypothetical protein